MGNDERSGVDIGTPVKKISKEITEKYVQEIIEEIIRRTLKKQTEKSNENKVLELEEKLKKLSDDEKIHRFKGSVDRVTDKIFKGGMGDKELIEKIGTEFEKNISSILLPTTKIIIAVSVLSVVLISTYIIFTPETRAMIESVTPNPASEGQIVTFNGWGIPAGADDYITAYRWESDRDGFLGSSSNLEISTLSAGQHKITLQVMDNHGKWSRTDSVIIVIRTSTKPTAHIESIKPDKTVFNGTQMTFSGSGTPSDRGGSITGYSWDSDRNGLLGSSETIEISTLSEGRHLITFRVMDEMGVWSEPDTAQIDVLPVSLPVARIDYIKPDTTVLTGTSMIFSGSGIPADKNDTIISYEWSFNTTILSNSNSFTYPNLPIGVHDISFRVRDSRGAWSKPDIVQVEVLKREAPQLSRIWDEAWAVGPYTWDAYNFAGFFYDLDENIGKEKLQILQPILTANQRTIDINRLVYYTGADQKRLKVVTEASGNNAGAANISGLCCIGPGQAFEDGNYYTAGWQGDKYVALNGKVDKLGMLAIEQGASSADKKTLTVGETWEIGDGWKLTAQSINAKATPRQAWLVLSKDGNKKDEKVISTGTIDARPIYTYIEKSFCGETDVPVFITYLDSVFSGATSDMLQLRYTWLIASTCTEIKSDSGYGVFKVANIDTAGRMLELRNTGTPVTLSRDSTVDLMGNLMFKIADRDDILRFMPVTLRTLPGNYEIRGAVWDQNSINGFGGTGTATTWNVYNFEGFFYDLNDDLGKEELQVLQTDLNANLRTIGSSRLVYKTGAQPKMLNAVKAAFSGNTTAAEISGLCCTGSGRTFQDGSYYTAGWQGDKYVALNGKINKLSKLAIEQGTSSADKKTLTVGETWEVGDGWTLTANSIDAKSTPRQAWITLIKDGVKKDDKVITTGTVNAEPTYTFVEKSLCGETDVPVFVTYLDSVFSGATTDMLQLRYTWLISSTCKEIWSGDKYGVFQVVNIDTAGRKLELQNTANAVTLTPDSTINLMGNLTFSVADRTEVLRFYPKVDVKII